MMAAGPKPVIGVLCCNEFAERPVQCVASRFIEPLARISGATVLLVPALIDTLDARSLGERLDGLLLTGARSNVAASRYGAVAGESCRVDEERDEVALALAGHMIEIGRPVFGICRGLQELNVLFGGTLQDTRGALHHTDRDDAAFEDMFSHRHDIELIAGGQLTRATGLRQARVNSVHRQGVSGLGAGLRVEAVASDDELVEAFSSRPCGGDVLAVQWHPEWETADCPASRSFFALFGSSVRTSAGGAVFT
jgi:putative glutamine amidotransferase